MNDLVDVSLDMASGPYYGSSFWKILPRLAILYFVLLFLCWNEIRFQTFAVEVPGHAEIVGQGRKGASRIRYTFLDPETGHQRQNTISIGNPKIPADGSVAVQVISGETISSRLKLQARPWVINFVIIIHALFLLAMIVGFGYLSWEANDRPLTRQQKAMLAWRKKKAAAMTVN